MNKHTVRLNVLLIIMCMLTNTAHGITTLMKNDPYPLYSSYQAFNLLSRDQKEGLKQRTLDQTWDECIEDCDDSEHFGFSIFPFFQKEIRGRNF